MEIQSPQMDSELNVTTCISYRRLQTGNDAFMSHDFWISNHCVDRNTKNNFPVISRINLQYHDEIHMNTIRF